MRCHVAISLRRINRNHRSEEAAIEAAAASNGSDRIGGCIRTANKRACGSRGSPTTTGTASLPYPSVAGCGMLQRWLALPATHGSVLKWLNIRTILYFVKTSLNLLNMMDIFCG